MNWRVDFKGWRFYVALSHSVKVKGVNSKLPSGRHILLWDFDNVEVENVKKALETVQKRFKLSPIYLINTGLDSYWHAYCYSIRDWSDTLHILSSTPYLDEAYFKIGIIRGYFTLRYTPKKDRAFKPAIVLPSKYKEDISPFELVSGAEYWTKRK